ncbi:MAG TPA: NUDIX domain-containing protein [Mariprofundaceae bacterium]|nr:NUDIX domain-containing protein [Mariprofundaceae bacterium]
MNEQVIALVAAFDSSGELLLLRRPDDVHCGGLWSLPGGKVEDAETPLDTAARELQEETGLVGSYWRQLGRFRHDYPARCLNFFVFTCICRDLAGFSPESEAAWVPLADIGQYPMPEANAKLLPLLKLPSVGAYLQELSTAP